MFSGTVHHMNLGFSSLLTPLSQIFLHGDLRNFAQTDTYTRTHNPLFTPNSMTSKISYYQLKICRD